MVEENIIDIYQGRYDEAIHRGQPIWDPVADILCRNKSSTHLFQMMPASKAAVVWGEKMHGTVCCSALVQTPVAKCVPLSIHLQ
jgi:hypothetical protein